MKASGETSKQQFAAMNCFWLGLGLIAFINLSTCQDVKIGGACKSDRQCNVKGAKVSPNFCSSKKKEKRVCKKLCDSSDECEDPILDFCDLGVKGEKFTRKCVRKTNRVNKRLKGVTATVKDTQLCVRHEQCKFNEICALSRKESKAKGSTTKLEFWCRNTDGEKCIFDKGNYTVTRVGELDPEALKADKRKYGKNLEYKEIKHNGLFDKNHDWLVTVYFKTASCNKPGFNCVNSDRFQQDSINYGNCVKDFLGHEAQEQKEGASQNLNGAFALIRLELEKDAWNALPGNKDGTARMILAAIS